MNELIEQLRQLIEDNREEGTLPVVLVEHVLSNHTGRLTYEYAARGSMYDSEDSRIWQQGLSPFAQYDYALGLLQRWPDKGFMIVRRAHVPEFYGEWEPLP